MKLTPEKQVTKNIICDITNLSRKYFVSSTNLNKYKVEPIYIYIQKNKIIAFDTYLRIISSKYYKYGYMRVKLYQQLKADKRQRRAIIMKNWSSLYVAF